MKMSKLTNCDFADFFNVKSNDFFLRNGKVTIERTQFRDIFRAIRRPKFASLGSFPLHSKQNVTHRQEQRRELLHQDNMKDHTCRIPEKAICSSHVLTDFQT